MANFTEIKTGGWNDEDVLTGDQLSEIQNNMLKTPNFSEGSEHTTTGQVRVLGAEGMYIETLEVGSLAGRTIPLVRTVSSWPDDVVEHVISQGNVVLGQVDATSVQLSLVPDGATQGDWVRVTCQRAGAGVLVVTNNGTPMSPSVAMDNGDQLVFSYFTSGGWVRC